MPKCRVHERKWVFHKVVCRIPGGPGSGTYLLFFYSPARQFSPTGRFERRLAFHRSHKLSSLMAFKTGGLFFSNRTWIYGCLGKLQKVHSCNYNIENISGRRHSIRPLDHTLKINLLDNNTVVKSAKLKVSVHARTWIWKGVNFGFLGCMKITSCGGQVVTYSAFIDMYLSFGVNWNETTKKIDVTIRPVNTDLKVHFLIMITKCVGHRNSIWYSHISLS